MGYFSDIRDGLLTAAKGMRVTLGHLRERPNTVQWPHEPATTKPGSRHQLNNEVVECIGCLRCAQACPVDCITIETVRSTKDVDLGRTTNGSKKTLHLAKFDIDMAKCCYCGLCADTCNTGALTMTPTFEYSQPRVQGLYFAFATMTPAEIEAAQQALAAEKAAQAAERAAKAKADKEKKAQAAAQGEVATADATQAQEK